MNTGACAVARFDCTYAARVDSCAMPHLRARIIAGRAACGGHHNKQRMRQSNQMILTTPETGQSSLGLAIETVEQQLADMKADLLNLQRRITSGDFDALKDGTKVTGEIRQWLKLALETEIRLEERRKQHDGIVNHYAIDFEEARDQIGGRLDRLRAAQCPTGVPGQPD